MQSAGSPQSLIEVQLWTNCQMKTALCFLLLVIPITCYLARKDIQPQLPINDEFFEDITLFWSPYTKKIESIKRKRKKRRLQLLFYYLAACRNDVRPNNVKSKLQTEKVYDNLQKITK